MHNFELNYNQKPEILLSDCDISSRALNHLRSVRIDKLNDLVNFTEEELKEKMPMANSKTFCIPNSEPTCTKKGESLFLCYNC